LQRTAVWRSIWHNPEATTCPEQCSSDRTPAAKTIPRQAVAETAALVAGGEQNQVQDGSDHVQGPAYRDTNLPQPTLTDPQLHPYPVLIEYSFAVLTCHRVQLVVFVTRHLLFGTHCLEQF